MAKSRSPKTEKTTTPDATASAPLPGIGSVEIPRPEWLGDGDDVVMHDDLIDLVRDSKDCRRAVMVLVTLLRSSTGDESAVLQAHERRGLAELLDYVQARLENVVENASHVALVMGLPNVAAIV